METYIYMAMQHKENHCTFGTCGETYGKQWKHQSDHGDMNHSKDYLYKTIKTVVTHENGGFKPYKW